MHRPPLLFAVACCAFAAACSGTASTGQGSNAGDRQSDAPPAAPAPSATEAATLEFTAPAVDGTTFRGADYAGDALAIWFWAPW
ncbi:MAG TPA: hypothetical protein VMX12_01575 [Acidimicrobiia bacterium]|nr:hypothetical protein [Acidimicrobiia bacterium]